MAQALFLFSFLCACEWNPGREKSFVLTNPSFAAGVECPSFVYTSEIFPAGWRALGVGVSLSAVQLWSAILTGAAAIAFEHIKW